MLYVLLLLLLLIENLLSRHAVVWWSYRRGNRRSDCGVPPWILAWWSGYLQRIQHPLYDGELHSVLVPGQIWWEQCIIFPRMESPMKRLSLILLQLVLFSEWMEEIRQ